MVGPDAQLDFGADVHGVGCSCLSRIIHLFGPKPLFSGVWEAQPSDETTSSTHSNLTVQSLYCLVPIQPTFQVVDQYPKVFGLFCAEGKHGLSSAEHSGNCADIDSIGIAATFMFLFPYGGGWDAFLVEE